MCVCVVCFLVGCDTDLSSIDVVHQNSTVNLNSLPAPPDLTPAEQIWLNEFRSNLRMDRMMGGSCNCTLEVISVSFDKPNYANEAILIDNSSQPNPFCQTYALSASGSENCPPFVVGDPDCITTSQLSTAGFAPSLTNFNSIVGESDVLTMRATYFDTDEQDCSFSTLTTPIIPQDQVTVTVRVDCSTVTDSGEPTNVPGCGSTPSSPGNFPTNIHTFRFDAQTSTGFGRFTFDDCCVPHFINP